jgi:Tfp pilus assembly protein PilF
VSSRRLLRSACLSALAVLSGCGLELGPVTRVVDGIPEEGRFVSPTAYAAYARGAYFEAKGDLGAALEAYRLALDEDSHSAEIQTRIGAVLCKTTAAGAPVSAKRAVERAFDEAVDLDPDYAPAWHERAVCLASWKRPEQALAAARTAVRLDPDRVETSLLVAELCRELGRAEEARTWLDALVTRRPSSRAAALALLASARRDGDRGRELRARELLRRNALVAELRASGEARVRGGDDVLDLALARGDLDGARRAALGAGVTPGELAARAVVLGRLEMASRQAELVISADPSNSDAWIAGLVAADLRGDEAEFTAWLERLDAAPSTPHPLAARLLAELLGRRVSSEAARAFRGGYGAEAAEPGAR